MPLNVIQPSRSELKRPAKEIIAVAAGKGGVGKSTITVNLALALKAKGFQVGILDADIYGPSIRKMLPEDRMPVQRGEIIVPALSHGIEMISIAYFRREGEAAAVRAPIANSMISQFIKKVDWGLLDYLLVDFPPGTGDIQLTLSQQANLSGAVMVTTPQEVSLLDVRKAMHLFEQVNIPVIGIIENMSYYIPPGTNHIQYLFGKEGGAKLAREAGVPLLGQIPVDPLISEFGDQGRSLFSLRENDSNIHQTFMEVAEQVAVHHNAIKESGNLNNFELVWKSEHE